MLIAKFVPYEVTRHCISEQEAIECVKLIKDIAETLSKSYAVYMRTAPHYIIEKDFPTMTYNYYVKCRMSIGPPEVGVGFR